MRQNYLAGLDLLATVGVIENELRNRAAEIAPDFVGQAIGFAFGEIFSRSGLDLRIRLLVAVAMQASAGTSVDQLREHVTGALNLGWSRLEIIEVIIQTAVVAGVPVALQALADCHDLLNVKDQAAPSCEASSADTGQE